MAINYTLAVQLPVASKTSAVLASSLPPSTGGNAANTSTGPGGTDQLGKLARDAQLIFSQIPVTEQRIVESVYREPMVLGQLKEEPFSIELVRVVNLYAPQTPMKCGSTVHFTWLPNQGGAVIASIDGLSPVNDGQLKLRFYFLITYSVE